MSLEIGIVGLPNVGKSTLFSALTHVSAEAANYPFCTIDPNVGMVPLHDPRMYRLTDLVQPNKVVPAMLRVVDIAGLVKGASEGEGLGNRFLGHIREVDAIAHVVRCFEDENITHVSGSLDPLRDIETIQTELILSDLELVERKCQRTQKQLKGNKALAADIAVYEKVIEHLNEGKPARTLKVTEDSEDLIRELALITMKPTVYIANVSEDGLKTPTEEEQTLRSYAQKEGAEVIPICAQFESELAEMDAEDAELFLEEMGIEESGVARLAQVGYHLLGQITYFTAGKQEVRAWEIRDGWSAPQAAGKIHTDFEKGFIRAEVYHYNDIDELGSETAVKDAGRWRLEGKDYLVRDGDIIHFRFNV